MKRRQFIKGAVAAGAALGFPYMKFPSKQRLRIGYLPITDATPLLIAHSNGYFKDEGIDAEKPVRVRAWSTLAESFMTGKFNLTHMLLPMPIWMRFNSGVDIKILAWNHTNGSAVTIRGDSGIKGFSDLRGKQIAVPYWYSMHNVILQMGLKKAGLIPVIKNQSERLGPREVNLFILSPSEMPAALMGKKIDGYIVAEPFNALGELKIGAKIMRFTGDMWKNHPCCVVVMKGAEIDGDPVFTQKVTNAIVRAQLWINAHPLKTAKILSREGNNYLPISEQTLKKVFSDYRLSQYGAPNVPAAIQNPDWQLNRIGFQPYPYPSATTFIIERMKTTLVEGNAAFLKELNAVKAENALVDKRFVRNAINNSGGIEKFEFVDPAHPWDREEVFAI